MKDYSAMSDDEIASDVLLALGYKMADEGYSYRIFLSDNSRKDTGSKAYSKFKFYPCNNPADAWPIITANKITIIACADKWIAVPIGSIIDGDTSEKESMMYCNSFSNAHGVSDVNPLRAAMIVYLQMMEKKS